MKSKRSIVSTLSLLATTAMAVPLAQAQAADGGAQAEKPYTFTGHIDVVSRYYLRGVTTTYGNSRPGLGNEGADAPESDKPALQLGVDYVHQSGWYAGYFGSTINYSYKRLGQSYSDRTILDGFQDNKSFENDFYGGYGGKAGDFGYTIGLTGYYYVNGKSSDAFETKLGISYGEFSLTAQTLLNDVVWGNKGDTYVALTYVKPDLPYGITFTGSLGGYLYAKEGKFLGTRDTLTGEECSPGTAFVVNGCYEGNQPIRSGFRHLILGISQPIGDTGLAWGLQGIIGGENRYGVRQANKGVVSLSYLF